MGRILVPIRFPIILKMKSKYHKQIQEFLWNRKGGAFEFSEFKKKIVGYTAYGGKKYLVWLKKTYNLREFKEGHRTMLQKIPKEELPTTED